MLKEDVKFKRGGESERKSIGHLSKCKRMSEWARTDKQCVCGADSKEIQREGL